MDDLPLRPATELARAIKSREVSSRELLDEFMQRIEKRNPQLNAVVTFDTDRAQAAANAADELTASTPLEGLGPLHGLPITIKDAIETAGIRSTGGARELENHVPEYDAPAVARLKAAGAIVFGKTNVPTWSADIQTYNDLFGVTNNPWDLTRTPGGSSGGAAAAVATGLTSFEVGTDIGGSVRIPSSFCGLFGHKPSFGIVPQRGYLDHVGGGTIDPDINVFGPIARSAGDLEVLLDVLIAPKPEDVKAWTIDLPVPRHHHIGDYRIGTWLDDPALETSSEVLAVLQQASDALAGAGARVTEARPGLDLGAVRALFNNLILPAISVSVPGELGQALSGNHRDWLELNIERQAMRKVWEQWFEEYDLLLCPVMPMPAIEHDHTGTFAERTIVINGTTRQLADTLAWTGLVGVAYLPSTVVPVGRTPDNLPVGIQIVGPYLEDKTTLHLAQRLEQLTGGFVAPPLA